MHYLKPPIVHFFKNVSYYAEIIKKVGSFGAYFMISRRIAKLKIAIINEPIIYNLFSNVLQ